MKSGISRTNLQSILIGILTTTKEERVSAGYVTFYSASGVSIQNWSTYLSALMISEHRESSLLDQRIARKLKELTLQDMIDEVDRFK